MGRSAEERAAVAAAIAAAAQQVRGVGGRGIANEELIGGRGCLSSVILCNPVMGGCQ